MNIGYTGTVSSPLGNNASIGVNPISGTGGINLHGNSGNIGYNLGIGSGPGGFGVTPTVSLGSSPGAQTGSSLGGTAGGFVGTIGGPFGAAAGSLVGSALGSGIGGQFGSSKGPGQLARDSIRSNLQKTGLVDSNYNFLLPDGSTMNLGNDGGAANHTWSDPTQKTPAHASINNLSAYDTDYTNDLDYLSSMGGINLSRLLSGGKNTAVDQLGSQIGNGALGKTGYNAQFTPDNFNNVATNMRSIYAKAGIHNIQDALSLASTAYSQGRINDTDYAASQQAAKIFFGNDYNSAAALMKGRHGGIQQAATSPVPGQGMQGGYSYNPYHMLSLQEAFNSLDPFFNEFRKRLPNTRPLQSTGSQNLLGALGIGTSLLGAVGAINKGMGGGLGASISQLFHSAIGSGGFQGATAGGSAQTPGGSPINVGGSDSGLTGINSMDSGSTGAQDFSNSGDSFSADNSSSGGFNLPDFSFSL